MSPDAQYLSEEPAERCNVIVVMYNSSSTIGHLIDGLSANRSVIAEIAIVDNGSRDDSASVANRCASEAELPVRLIRATNSGFAGGHWTARAAFKDSSLPTLCVNPDVKLSADVVAQMLKVYASSTFPIGVLTAPLIGIDGEEDSALRRKLPTAVSGTFYSMLGKLLPRQLRYNYVKRVEADHKVSGVAVTRTEATTGALMLIAPEFRAVETGLFDRDYFMYGEDLQLCFDARAEGYGVYVVETAPSVHIKGVSSGWPRSWHSNRAFHDAMHLYYKKNLALSPLDAAIVRVAARVRLLVTAAVGTATKLLRNQA